MDLELLQERYELVSKRVEEIAAEGLQDSVFSDYFKTVAGFLCRVFKEREFVLGGGLDTTSFDELLKRNHALYEDIHGDNYNDSYANPEVCAKKTGKEFGTMLSAIYAKVRSAISDIYDDDAEDLVQRAELFVEVYVAFETALNEDGKAPAYEDIKDILYWNQCDYFEETVEKSIANMLDTSKNFFVDIVKKSDLNDLRYLFKYGYFVSDNEIKIAEFLNKADEETVSKMADTYTEGYRIGFEVAGIDLKKKTTVEVYYPVGFERMIRKAIENFEAMGLKVSVRRKPDLEPRDAFCYATHANRQYCFDHKDDRALYLDKNMANRIVEGYANSYEKYKKEALGYAGPAVVETFGQNTFDPVNKPENAKCSKEQDKLDRELDAKIFEIMRTYINYEERSFTIISFPIPEIGDKFDEIFAETIKINTLDYRKYQSIQSKIIDALDEAKYVHVKGSGKNITDICVNLHELKNPAKETNFENCVADVNIPVGEVFTSPVLEETNGVLNVSRVFLNGLEYRDLTITFKDGKIADYNCSNFSTEEENKRFIYENVLFKHDTLPIGEFAIGTNTTAYVFANKYNIADKLPILIAEKTGPHFAVGDTCYSHSEEVVLHNPDGKEIIAKDNSCSLLRNTNPAEAYFDCHTDITIPYDELEIIEGVKEDGSRFSIIENGRFVLSGTEELNEAFEN
ncbi:MAG: aminopeptidase [Lachnospiraceae bacterium]|nr:aminopeptidase [Lachnospiraceae bacterium]